MRNPLPIAALAALAGIAPAALATCSSVPGSAVQAGDPDGAALRPLPENPVELGRVAWGRDLDAALAEARATGKPVFALFQEIPGCATCRRFGEGPLSDPLLVEAIEDLFVPVAIHNNRPGADARALERFDEPSWNNPVVRFLDADGRDVVPRRDRVWTTGGIARRASDALEAAGRDAPAWLATVAPAAEVDELARATFTMFCFWSGEAALGAVDGVVATRAAWAGGREAVEVRYDPARVSPERLARAAATSRCAPSDEPASRAARDSDRKHALRGAWRFLPLNAMQRTKANAALAAGRSPGDWISPRQAALLARVERTLASDPDRLRAVGEAPDDPGDPGAVARHQERLVAALRPAPTAAASR